jgi:HJR/Mrr/RecB family endonuclease
MKLTEIEEKVYVKNNSKFFAYSIFSSINIIKEKKYNYHSDILLLFSEKEEGNDNDYSKFLMIEEFEDKENNSFLIDHPYINSELNELRLKYIPLSYGRIELSNDYDFRNYYLPRYGCIILPKLIKENENFKSLILDIAKSGKNTISHLIKPIEKCFLLANVSFEEAYIRSDLKSGKKNIIECIDQNTRNFIKNNRIYAGLAYLKDTILLIKYGFSTNCFTEERREPFKFITEVNYYLLIIWRLGAFVDEENVILNKIIENLFMLFDKSGYLEPIIELYDTSQKDEINLRADTLVCIIEALLQHNEKSLIESAVTKLQKIEPRHPIIETANKALRRMQVLNQVSEAFNINISDLQKLNGVEFEIFLENQFVKNGFKVERTKGSGDFGADLIVETSSGTRASIQAKRYKQKANLKAVQEVVASLAHYQNDFGIVITTSGFFQSAIDLAETNNVELWDEDKLIQFLSGDFSFSMLNES